MHELEALDDMKQKSGAGVAMNSRDLQLINNNDGECLMKLESMDLLSMPPDELADIPASEHIDEPSSVRKLRKSPTR